MNIDQSITNKDVQYIFYKKYKYQFIPVMKNSRFIFKCINNLCSASIEMDDLVEKIICSRGKHLHDCLDNNDFIRDTSIKKVKKNSQNINKPLIIKDHELTAEENNPVIVIDDNDETTRPSNKKKIKFSPIVVQLQKEAPKQSFEMSRKKYVNFDDFCIDDDGNEIIVLQESNSSIPEETEENNVGGYKYVYPKGQAYDNNRTQYQYINAPNNNEHNSSSIYKATCSVQKSAVRQSIDLAEWKDEELNLMLKRYKEYFPNIGKDKKFKSRKEVWKTIAEEINNTFKVRRSSNQCISKFFHFFHSLKKPKKQGEETTGTFQDELDSIDSIHEVIMEDLETARINEIDVNQDLTNPESLLSLVLPKTMIELAKINAHAQERRHREYMELVKGFENKFMDNVSKIIDKM